MALPSSGPLSISQIRNEEVNNGGFASTYSLRQLSANAGKSTPDAISEFYGYNACPAAGTYYSSFCSGCALYYTYTNGNCGYYSNLIDPNSSSCGPGCGSQGTCCDCGYGCDCGYIAPCYVYGCYDCIN